MSLNPRHLYRTSWLTLIAFLFAMFGSVAGLAGGQTSNALTLWLQLCGADGHKLVAVQVVDDAEPASAEADVAKAGLCLLCFSPATAADDPPIALVGRTGAYLRVVLPVERRTTVSAVWPASYPRGPPLSI